MTKRTCIAAIALAAVLGYAGSVRADGPFTVHSLKGTFGVSGSGTLFGLPAAVVGLTRFDGLGGCGLKGVLNAAILGGTVVPLSSTSCSYAVNADGTGSSEVTFEGPVAGPFTSTFVILDKKELYFILSDAVGGTVASGVSKRQSAGRD